VDPASQIDPHAVTPAGKPRARSLGVPFRGQPGRWNAITDVPGVEVGYATLIRGESVRTGVTAIHPRGPAGAADPVTAGFFSQNGNGEMTGVSWIEESGTFAGPVAITNTHAVGVVHAAIIAWTVRRHPRAAAAWLLPVVAETWDGYLNDINSPHVTGQAAAGALESSASGPVEEGSVGGGTGMNCYGFKGGSGTASRLVEHAGSTYTVGVFVQANFGVRAELTLSGLPVGELLSDDNPMTQHFSPRRRGLARSSRSWRPTRRCCPASARRLPGGSRSAWPAPAPRARISPATCSLRSPPATLARLFRPPTRRAPTARPATASCVLSPGVSLIPSTPP